MYTIYIVYTYIYYKRTIIVSDLNPFNKDSLNVYSMLSDGGSPPSFIS